VITLGSKRHKRIGLGSNRLTDTPENRAFLAAAVEAGVDFIDTAHLYTSGESERTIGATLAPFPAQLTVATKGAYARGTGPDDLRAHLDESLERLRTDRIELYYVHRIHPDNSVESMVSVLAEARDAGKIEHAGVSEVSVEQLELARTVMPIAAVQNEYSVGERDHDEVLDLCAEHEILFVPFFPLRGGDRRAIAEIAEAHGATPNQVRLAWLLQRSPVMLPIPGTLSIEHLRENLGALELELDDEQFERLR
jgi:pyridoxine 4-dehydrogenase